MSYKKVRHDTVQPTPTHIQYCIPHRLISCREGFFGWSRFRFLILSMQKSHDISVGRSFGIIFCRFFPFSRFFGNHINFLSSPSFCPWIWQETVFLSNRHVEARPRFFCKNISIQLVPANCTQIAWMRLALKLKYFFGLRYILDTTSM